MTSSATTVTDRVRLGVLTEYVGPDLVDEVVAAAGATQRRVRRLPAGLVVYFVLALCLFSGADSLAPPGYRSVLASLVRHLPHGSDGYALPVSSALTKARQRLGVAPLRLLFDRLRGRLAGSATPGAFGLGLHLVSWDAALVDTQDTVECAATFGHHGPAGIGNPQLRIMTLIECGTHALIDAVFDGAAVASEIEQAHLLVGSLRPGMLLLADRNFPGHALWAAASASGAQLLWRVRSRNRYDPTTPLPDGSYLSVMPTPEDSHRRAAARFHGRPLTQPPAGHPVRVINYQVLIDTPGQPTRIEDVRLLTTLLDHERHPADQLAALYPQRWESETGYDELKAHLKGAGHALRSKTPDLIRQETYALLATYQALCALRHKAAHTDHLDPDRISFTATLRTARDSISDQAARTASSLRRAHRTAIREILDQRLPPRRNRSQPRHVKPRQIKYPTKHRGQPRPTGTTTRTIRINPNATPDARAP